jgi:hypothetical protein
MMTVRPSSSKIVLFSSWIYSTFLISIAYLIPQWSPGRQVSEAASI